MGGQVQQFFAIFYLYKLHHYIKHDLQLKYFLSYMDDFIILSNDKNILKDKYGVMGEELWNHANGIDLSKISDFNNVIPKDKSISHSQILFKDYNEENITLIIKEMIDVLTKRLRDSKKQTSCIGFGIGYSKNIGGGFYHTQKLQTSTNNDKVIYNTCINIFDLYFSLM